MNLSELAQEVDERSLPERFVDVGVEGHGRVLLGQDGHPLLLEHGNIS